MNNLLDEMMAMERFARWTICLMSSLLDEDRQFATLRVLMMMLTMRLISEPLAERASWSVASFSVQVFRMWSCQLLREIRNALASWLDVFDDRGHGLQQGRIGEQIVSSASDIVLLQECEAAFFEPEWNLAAANLLYFGEGGRVQRWESVCWGVLGILQISKQFQFSDL